MKIGEHGKVGMTSVAGAMLTMIMPVLYYAQPTNSTDGEILHHGPGTAPPTRSEGRRSQPLRLSSGRASPYVNDCELVESILAKLEPRFLQSSGSVNDVVHSLRLWELDSMRRCTECLTGGELLLLLTSSPSFESQWPEAEEPLIRPTRDGLAVRVGNGITSTAHKDQLLAALAEAGAPLDLSIEFSSGAGFVGDLLRYALATFSFNSRDLAWTSVALALYMPPETCWRSAVGEAVCFDDLAERLMDFPPSWGTCHGQHRLYALTVLLQADDQVRILSPYERRKVVERLWQVSAVLVANQLPDGSWPADWFEGRSSTEAKLDSVEVRLRVTTHVLEWWALAPEEVAPPRRVIERATKWIASIVDGWEAAKVREHYTTLSHGGRALMLWSRGRCEE